MAETTNPILQQLDLLMLGYGFNFYRAESKLRADDLLVRQKACAQLGRAASRIGDLTAEFQNTCIPAPTRDQPYPPPELTRRLADLQSLRQRIFDSAAMIQGLPAPAQDRIWRRLRDEHTVLQSLLTADLGLLQRTAAVAEAAAGLTAPAWTHTDAESPLLQHLTAIHELCQARQNLLEIPTP